MTDRIEPLLSDPHAWSVGFEEGKALRKHGALPENLDDSREVMHEKPHHIIADRRFRTTLRGEPDLRRAISVDRTAMRCIE